MSAIETQKPMKAYDRQTMKMKSYEVCGERNDLH